MIKTQVQIPDELYRAAKRVARERELSFAEVMRRGLEYIVTVYPTLDKEPWELPRVNEGEGPTISLADIQQAREEDLDKLR
ncbi:MAG: hypothetical protein ACO3N7_08610 [Kiritimatiellia bacterium]